MTAYNDTARPPRTGQRRPAGQATAIETDAPATDKQRGYIAQLFDNLGWHSEQIAVYASEQGLNLAALTRTEASTLIEQLKRLGDAPAPACRACGKTSVGTHGLCDACLVDRVNGAGELELDDPDDLFARPPRSVARAQQQATITCRVCGARSQQSIHTPALLCPACLLDLTATAAHVAYVREATLERLGVASDAWLTTVEALDAATRARWLAVCEARQSLAPDVFQAKWDRTKRQGGAFAALLDAYELNVQAADAAAAQLAWCDAAEAEIAAASSK